MTARPIADSRTGGRSTSARSFNGCRRPPTSSWIWFFVFGCLCAAVFPVVPTGTAQAAVQVPVYAASGALVARTWCRRRSVQPDPLLTLAAWAFGAYFVASIGGVLFPLMGPVTPDQVPSPLDGLFLLSYALLGVYLWRMGSRSIGIRRRDLLDTLIVTGGVAPVYGFFFLEPLLNSAAPLAATLTYIAYPTVVFGLLAITVRLAFVAGRRTTPHVLLAAWIMLELLADIVFLHRTVSDTYSYGESWQAMWIVSAACVGALALHPETGLLLERRTSRPVNGARRLVVLAVCLVLPILTVIYAEVREEGGVIVVVACAAALLLVILMCLRLSGLMVDNASQLQVHRDLRRLSDDLAHQALHDPLTGLGNRMLFADRADHALAQRPIQPDRGTAILLLDLDDFKTVNDTFGHDAGDGVLVAVARRLQKVTRQGDGIFRLGGDEFAFVLPHARMSEVLRLADRIYQTLGEPLEVGPRVIRPSASLGVSIALDGQSRSTLLAEADMAMYTGKSQMTNKVSVFDPAMHHAILERYELERDLRDAVGQHEFRLLYQPIIDLQDDDIVGVEALLRWEHPTRGTISPLEFISLAEESGVICGIGDWVIEEALRQLLVWDEAHPGVRLKMSVNVSPRQLADPDFVDRAAGMLRASGVDPGRITLEITESAFGNDALVMIERVHGLKALGVTLAIDDFGTDYSSLSHLRDLPVDTIKVDKTFVDDIATHPQALALVTAIVRLAESLGKTTIAEGVETGSQLTHLQDLQVGLAQGYLFARPLAPEAIGMRLAATLEGALVH